MKFIKHFLILISIGFCTSGFAQQADGQEPLNADDQIVLQQWMNNLYEHGVRIDGDSIHITAEAWLAATDTMWRTVLYPKEYSWLTAKKLIETQHLKEALWFLINLYTLPENQSLVLEVVKDMQSYFDIPRALVASYYTFAFFDPNVSTLQDGKPVIEHPDILEEKLNAMTDITAKINQGILSVEASRE